ncbi:MAG TPA: serine hydrolase [Steroidobacteraceae bacterium]|nr:serine hydrolase [Steroidobacteraceae bacterium]
MLLLALHIPFAAAAPDHTAGDARTAQVDALFSAWAKADSPGCVTGVMSQGKLLYAQGYGLADVARGITLSPDTVFDIASMTKQFTAATIGLLMLDRKLALTDDVRVRFPELPIDVPITLGNLIHHESGIRDYTELNALRGVEAIDNRGVVTLLARQRGLDFPPGSQFAYSNSNYVLLAELTQRVSGQSLASVSRTRIFDPLQMHSTRYAASLKEDPARLANSYFPSEPDKFVAVPRDTQTVGDGNLLTTVRDLARWDENFYTNRVGGKTLSQLMRTAGALPSGERVPYGFGLMFGEYRGIPIESHGGSYHGFRTELLRFPRQHFSVSVLCNVASANAFGLATQIADIYLVDVLQPPPTLGKTPIEVKIDPEVFDAYVGEYLIETNGQFNVLRFARQDGRYFALPIGQSPAEVFALSESEFFPKGDDVKMIFSREKDGAVSRVTLHRAQGDLVGLRITVPTAGQELLTQLAGTYYSQEADTEMRLEVLGEQMVANVGRNQPFALLQVSDSSFAIPGGGALQFNRDPDGSISGLIFSSSRIRKLPFVRKSKSSER